MILRVYIDFVRTRDVSEIPDAIRDVLDGWTLHTNNVQIRDDDLEADRVLVNFQCLVHTSEAYIVVMTQCFEEPTDQCLVTVVHIARDGSYEISFNRSIPLE